MMRKAGAAGRGVRLPGKRKGPVGRRAGAAGGRLVVLGDTGDSDSDEDLAAAEAGSEEPEDPCGYGVSLTLGQTREACSPPGIADGVGAALAAVVAQSVKILPRGDPPSPGRAADALDGSSALAAWSLAEYEKGSVGQTQYLAALSEALTALCNGRWGFFHTRGPPARRLLASACQLQAEMMSVSHDDATFQNAVDFWKSASEALLRSARHVARRSKGSITDLAVLFKPSESGGSGEGGGDGKLSDFSPYQSAVERVRKVCVARMGKPKEVLLVVDEDTGEIERQERTDLHELATFRDLRAILRNLTPLGGRDTVGLLLKRLDVCNGTTKALAEQAAASKLAPASAPDAAMRLLQEQLRHRTSINKLCWSLGAVSGTLPPDIEARFLVTSVKGLLDMTDRARGRDDKGVVASGIMYVCGQYPSFLIKHWRFLETVSDKLCDFCAEKRSPAVQDMAVEHLLRIARACGECFVPQPARPRPYIVDLCSRSAAVCYDLAPHQAETFFKACGAVLARCPLGKAADAVTDSLLAAPMQQWSRVVTAAHSNLQILQAPESALTLARLAKLLRAVASETGGRFARPLGRVFLDSVNLVRALGAFILRVATGPGGPAQLRSDSGRGMKAARKALLEMIRAFVRSAGQENPAVVVKEFLPHIVPRLTEHLQQASESENAAATAEASAIALLRDCCRGRLGSAIAAAGHLGKIATAAADSIGVAFADAGRRAAAMAQSTASLPRTVQHRGLTGGAAGAGAAGAAAGGGGGGGSWGGWDSSGADGEMKLESVGGQSVELRQRYLSLCTALLATRGEDGAPAGEKSLFAASAAAMGEVRTVAVCEMGIDASLSADRRLSGPGLRLLIRLVRGFQAAPAAFAQQFFRAAWLRVATTVLVALTDRMHAGDLDAHATLIGELFAALESRAIGGPLWRDGDGEVLDEAESAEASGGGGGPASGKFGSNEEWVGYHLGVWLGSSFPHLGKERVVSFAGGLARAGAAMAGEADPAAVRATHSELKRLLADFAVDSLQLRPKEAAELFAEDPMAAAAALGVDVARDD